MTRIRYLGRRYVDSYQPVVPLDSDFSDAGDAHKIALQRLKARDWARKMVAHLPTTYEVYVAQQRERGLPRPPRGRR